jgi:hypothetical protein
MSEQTKTCIYCRQDDREKFKGVEHVIPQAFGSFGSETPTLDSVCDDCNSYFGSALDQYLARETVEGLVRYRRGIFSSQARPQRYLHITLAPGPETGSFAGMRMAIDGTSGGFMKPKAQFHILNQQTGLEEVYFDHQLAGLNFPEEEYGKPGADGQPGAWKCRILAASKEEHDEFADKLRANGINFTSGAQLPGLEPNEANADEISFPVEINGEVGPEHRRAHAKILLNVIARYLGNDEALLPHWDFVRRYARYGEGDVKWRLIEDAVPPGKEEEWPRLLGDSIVIRIENLKGHIVGTLMFYGNHMYQYVLRENSSLQVNQEFGMQFVLGKNPSFITVI